MVKSYLRYELARSFGVVASRRAACIALPGKLLLIATAAVDTVQIWDVRRGEVVCRCSSAGAHRAGEITTLAVGDDKGVIAAGYQDGSIRVWDWSRESEEGNERVVFEGHRAGVSSLSFERISGGRSGGKEKSGGRLVSGSDDGDVIVWDLEGQVGLFRLAAHINRVTCCVLLGDWEVVLSTSKDGLMKVYDVKSQFCLQTVVGHRGEIWDMDIDLLTGLIATGSIDAEIRIYQLRNREEVERQKDQVVDERVVVSLGSVKRKTAAKRVGSLMFVHCGAQTFLGVSGADRNVEVFQVRNAHDAESHRKRRRKRSLKKKEKMEKKKEQGMLIDDDEDLDEDEDFSQIVALDHLSSLQAFKLPYSIRNLVLMLDASTSKPQKRSKKKKKTPKTDCVRMLVQYNNNAIELNRLRVSNTSQDSEDDDIIKRLSSLESAGHRGDVRAVAFSPDEASLLSVSSKGAKLWNISTRQCIRSMTISGYGISVAYLGIDAQYAAVGTKEGVLEVFSLGSGDAVLSMEDAHQGSIWSLTLDDNIANATTLVSGGADGKIKFWDFSKVAEDGSLRLVRTLEVSEEVLCVRISRGGGFSYLVASLMDGTVRAFHLDTLKPYLSFYGHKMPVMSLDVSSDGLLLATGSADKTLKIWGMDFGNLRHSIRAHDESVLSVAFQPETHYIFTGSRDGTLKYWDGDKFELITDLEGQRGEVWSISVNGDGEFLASASHDKLLRVWRRSDEPLFLEEEQERRMDETFESTLLDEDVKEAKKIKNTPVTSFMAKDEGLADVSAAGKRSLHAIKGGEKLLEAMVLGDQEMYRKMHTLDEAPNVLLLGRSGEGHVLNALENIRVADLEQALGLLPLDRATRLLEYAMMWLKDAYNNDDGDGGDRVDGCDCREARLSVEIVVRAVLMIVNLHHDQIVSGAVDRGMMVTLSDCVTKRMDEMRKGIGFNVAAMELWKRTLAEENDEAYRDWMARAKILKLKRNAVGGRRTRRMELV